MEHIEYNNNIHLVLKDLIDRKSKRDHSTFSLSALAKAINMPHSILSKLMHEDPSRRVSNPRLDTLCKIVHFFKKDGFNITLDELLEGLKQPPLEIPSSHVAERTSVPLYFLDSDLTQKIGSVELDLQNKSGNIIAFVSDEYIPPMFKKGSTFVVDQDAEPEHNTMVAAQLPGHEKILIRKLFIAGNKLELKIHDADPSPISLMPTMQYRIIGVVTQVNAKI